MFRVKKMETERIENYAAKVYRYEFSEEFIELLQIFSKVHRYDDQKVYKEEWEKWCKENEEIISSEERFLRQNGFNGDFESKMFISARYYFRNKDINKKDKVKRRDYIPCDKIFLENVRNHIKRFYENSKDGDDKVKPCIAYDDFCNKNKEIYENEYNRIKNIIEETQKIKITDDEIIIMKIKQTYKNKYFQLLKNNN